MASTRRKSAAVALAIVGIAGLSLASAAQINLNAQTLGAGQTLVASCDSAVTVGFTTVYNGTSKAYDASGVTISDIAALCEGQTIKVTVTGSAGTVVANSTSTILAGETSKTFPFSTNNPAADDTLNVAIVIHS